MKRESVEMIVRAIDPYNAPYIMRDPEIMAVFEMASMSARRGKISLAAHYLREAKTMVSEFGKERLTPATVEIGMGVTINLWSDRHAATIIRVTKQTVTVRRDKATLDPNFKPEWVEGGFAGHCTNQSKQSYTYKPDYDGTVETFHWAPSDVRYGKVGNPWLSRGRHEFYDYNF